MISSEETFFLRFLNMHVCRKTCCNLSENWPRSVFWVLSKLCCIRLQTQEHSFDSVILSLSTDLSCKIHKNHQYLAFFNNRNLCSVIIEEELDIVSHNVNIIAICQRQSKSFLAGILDAASDNYEKCICSIFKQDQDRGFCHNYLIWI